MYIIEVFKNNGYSGEYDSDLDRIELEAETETDAMDELEEFGEITDGYSNGNLGSPLFKYEFQLIKLSLDREKPNDYIEVAYSNTYQ